MTGLAPVRPTSPQPSPDSVDLLGPTLRLIDSRLVNVAGRPDLLRAAAGRWRVVAKAGAQQRLAQAAAQMQIGGIAGVVAGVWADTDAKIQGWIQDAELRQIKTAETLELAAGLLETTAETLSMTKVNYIRNGVAAINAELAIPSVDVMLRASRALIPHSQAALLSTERTVSSHVTGLEEVEKELRELAVCHDAQGGAHHFSVTIGDIVLWPSSWLPDFKLDNFEKWWGMVWPSDPTRRNLALGTGLMNVVTESKRVSTPYAAMTSPTGIFRNILTDTSEPVFDVYGNPLANATAHAAWGAGATYFSDFVAGKVTDRWGESIGNWLKGRGMFPQNENFSFHTGATKHLAGVNALTAFALTVKDPLFVDAGLASVDADGRVRANGALGEASSLLYDIGSVAGSGAGGMGLERWQAEELSRLSPEERMVHVKRTACADWLVAQGGVLLGRAADDHYDPMVRAGFAASGIGSVATAATWCGSGDSGHGGPPAAGGLVPPATVWTPASAHDDNQLLRNWHAWTHDPELSQSYAQSPEYRRDALFGSAAAELGLIGAVGLAGTVGPGGSAASWGSLEGLGWSLARTAVAP